MKYFFCFSTVITTFFSISCYASQLNLDEYIRTDNAPTSYTLALLDKSTVFHSLDVANIPLEVSPFIHASAQPDNTKELRVEPFPAEGGCPKHFIVQLSRRKSILRSAQFTEMLLKKEKNKPIKVEQKNLLHLLKVHLMIVMKSQGYLIERRARRMKKMKRQHHRMAKRW